MKCCACGGPWSEPTGHVHTPRMLLCGTCALDFFYWWKGMVNRRWGKARFYDFAVAPKYEEELPWTT